MRGVWKLPTSKLKVASNGSGQGPLDKTKVLKVLHLGPSWGFHVDLGEGI